MNVIQMNRMNNQMKKMKLSTESKNETELKDVMDSIPEHKRGDALAYLKSLVKAKAKSEEPAKNSKIHFRVTKVLKHEIKPRPEHKGETQYRFLCKTDLSHHCLTTFEKEDVVGENKVWIDDEDMGTSSEPLVQKYFETLSVVPKQVFGIMRVSTANQAGPQHVSLELQEAAIRAWIASRKFPADTRVKYINIVASAFQKVPERMEDIFTVVPNAVAVFYRVDRMTRNFTILNHNLASWFRMGLEMHFAEEKFVFNSRKPLDQNLLFMRMVLTATEESVKLGKRIRDAHQANLKKGKTCGRYAPYGYRYKNGKAVEDESEMLQIRDHILGNELTGEQLAEKKVYTMRSRYNIAFTDRQLASIRARFPVQE